MRPAGQPGGQMGRPAAKTSPLKQARPAGAATIRQEPFTKPQNAQASSHKGLPHQDILIVSGDTLMTLTNTVYSKPMNGMAGTSKNASKKHSSSVMDYQNHGTLGYCS